MKPIAFIKSPFLFKNGTPRQPTVCQQARGFITIEKSVFNNPEHSLEGLEDFTHVWIVFVFHKNNNSYTKAKVKPPRLNGKRVGLFSTRSPYRPNNIGLTLAKIESISGATLAVSGIDMIDGTPVLDIKPYIPQYDCPSFISTGNVIETDDKGDHLSAVGGFGDARSNIDATGTSNLVSRVETRSPGSVTESDTNKHTAEDFEDIRVNVDTASVIGMDNRSLEYVDDCNVNKCDENTVYDVNLDCKSADEKVHTTSGLAIGFDTDCHYGGTVNFDGTHDKSTEEVQTSKMKKVLSSQLSLESESLTEKDPNAGSMLGMSPRSTLSPSTVDETNRTAESVACSETHDRFNEKTSNFTSTTAPWIEKPPIQTLDVCFTPRALQQLEEFTNDTDKSSPFKLQFMKNSKEAKAAICDILKEDPRSTYRRKHCKDSLYYFTVDVVHVTCWFDDSLAEVVRVKPASLVDHCKHRFQ